jgi:hypothetical protein
MEFDRYTIALLLLRTDAPAFTEVEEAELQDAHMSHLSDLHDAGQLLAAGPVLGAPNRELRGFSILKVDPERARELTTRPGSPRGQIPDRGVSMVASCRSDRLLSRASSAVDR